MKVLLGATFVLVSGVCTWATENPFAGLTAGAILTALVAVVLAR